MNENVKKKMVVVLAVDKEVVKEVAEAVLDIQKKFDFSSLFA